jgi:hypothetical protein
VERDTARGAQVQRFQRQARTWAVWTDEGVSSRP